MNKIDEVIKSLKHSISSGELPPGSRIMSEYELAERFKINKTTANKAVSALVNSGLLERRPGRGGTVVTERPVENGSIAVLLEVEHPFFARILKGVQFVAYNNGFEVLVYFPGGRELDNCLHKIESKRNVKGVIACNYGKFSIKLPFPVIYNDYFSDRYEDAVYCVNGNDYLAGKMIIEELLRCGHTNIIGFTYLFNSCNFGPRHQGMVDAMREAGISEPGERLYRGFEESDGGRFLAAMNKKFPGFTAIACDTDGLVPIIYHSILKNGLKIPDDISITGIGNVYGNHNVYDLTTIDQQPFLVGVHAAELLISFLKNGVPDHSVHEVIEPKLIRRGSVGIIR